MAVTSSEGYAGTVGYDTHAKIAGMGARYTVEDATALAPSVGVGDRVVTTGAGVAMGHSIRDTLTETPTTLDAVGAGVRHDMTVLRRDWSTNTSTVVPIQGGTPEALPTRNVGPGALDDQPLALWRVTAGSTVPVLVADLRCWAGDGGLVAVSDRALDYLGERPGTRVTIGTVTWTRILSPAGAASWISDASDDTGWTSQPINNVRYTGTFRARRKDGVIEIDLRITRDNTATNGNDHTFSISSGFRPSHPRYPTAWLNSTSTGMTSRRATVNTNGQILIPDVTLAGGGSIALTYTYLQG